MSEGPGADHSLPIGLILRRAKGVVASPVPGYLIECLVWNVPDEGFGHSLITNESKSTSMIASVDGNGDGTYGLFAIYRNTPRAAVRHRSPIHHGALMLDVSGQPPTLLEGFYWTDRTTMGELNMQVRFKRLVNDYAAGRLLQ
jgi:hypothetical protein